MIVKIEGMSCGHCSGHVKEALEALDGVVKVDVNLQEGTAHIDGSVSQDAVKEAIDEAGYDVVGIE
ncbi:MAG: heavy-metal-associated domain-containing protein [Cellulosilyticaceae bacterium]